MNTDILINALKEYDMLKQIEICNANIMLLSNFQGEMNGLLHGKNLINT